MMLSVRGANISGNNVKISILIKAGGNTCQSVAQHLQDPFAEPEQVRTIKKNWAKAGIRKEGENIDAHGVEYTKDRL